MNFVPVQSNVHKTHRLNFKNIEWKFVYVSNSYWHVERCYMIVNNLINKAPFLYVIWWNIPKTCSPKPSDMLYQLKFKPWPWIDASIIRLNANRKLAILFIWILTHFQTLLLNPFAFHAGQWFKNPLRLKIYYNLNMYVHYASI